MSANGVRPVPRSVCVCPEGRVRQRTARPHFPDVELDVLDCWDRHGIFHETVAARNSEEDFVFCDGPPFANGPPHYGNLLAGHAKDVMPRYQTMRGTQDRATIRLDLARARPT